MSRTESYIGTMTVATGHTDLFEKQVLSIGSFIPFNTCKIEVIEETIPRMISRNRGAWTSVTDIDIRIPKLITDTEETFIGGAYYPSRSPYFLYLLPGFEEENVGYKRKNSEIGSGNVYFFFKKGSEIIKRTNIESRNIFGIEFEKAASSLILFFHTWAETCKDRELKVYSVENIYSAAKYATNNWTKWETGITSHKIIDDIVSQNVLPIGAMEVRRSLKNIYEWYKESTNKMCKEVRDSIVNNKGSFNYFYHKNQIGPLAYAFFTFEKDKKRNIEHKNTGSFVHIPFGDPMEAEGYLEYTGQNDSKYGTCLNYVLHGDDDNFYFLNTSVDLKELTSGVKEFIHVKISGKRGQQWTSKGRKFYGINFNNFKGRLKIKELL